ncbi:hypothetical protein P3W85_16595 [Cupriavidus basilensis]|uniref:Uncharacterized protein n=1 Tax=Cupriavidus basilensis TaxID=68895 RepID=A0ABT6APN6_9BURK|nr:hypothetical protein [Cupriavidus basilensis]MDF3834563.1 hypothetical protein [Cupriavidus basilensis]
MPHDSLEYDLGSTILLGPIAKKSRQSLDHGRDRVLLDGHCCFRCCFPPERFATLFILAGLAALVIATIGVPTTGVAGSGN